MPSFKTLPIYPILLAIYLPLIALSSNWGIINYNEALTVIGISVAVTGFVWFVLKRILKQTYVSAFIVACLLLVFYLYGHIMVTTFILGIDIFTPETLALLFIVLFALFVWSAFRYPEAIKRITMQLNIVVIYLTLVLLFINQPPFIRQLTRGSSDTSTVAEAYPIEAVEISSTATGYDEQQPDIYIILLDAAPREDVYAAMSGEELGFAAGLEELGFYVATDSKSNYMFTPALLPTLLNFDYLPNLINLSGDVDKSNARALADLMQENRACRTLQSIGYEYLTFDSTWGPTRYSVCSDEIYGQTDDIQEVTSLMINTTALRLFFYDNLIERIREARLGIYEQLIKIADNDAPTFTFAHIVMPHSPFIFDEDGSVPDGIDQRISIFSFAGDDEHSMEPFYLAQSAYTAEITIDTVKTIIEESDVPPIIIIMSDHGPDMPADFSNEYYEKRIPVFNAYYFPNGGDELLYPSITPVNSMRVLLSYYFGADLPLLEDRLYVTKWTEGVYYDFSDVTTRTLVENDQARIGIDWDENFYEIYEKQNDEFIPVLKIETALLNGADALSDIEANNGWHVSIAEGIFHVREDNEEIISLSIIE